MANWRPLRGRRSSSPALRVAFGFTVVLLANGYLRADPNVGGTSSAADLEFFEKNVRPLLVERCYGCHDTKKAKGGLRLTSRAAMVVGGDSGPALLAGVPDDSLLIQAIEYDGLYKMPPNGKLPSDEIRILRNWVQQGAPWPQHLEEREAVAADEEFDIESRKRSHWAWAQVRDPSPPHVADDGWPLDPIDNFILSRLEGGGLTPASAVPPAALVRRVYFDLVGLPPPADQVRRFAAHPSQEALSELVDELLRSPHFGEKWGRHWLDLVRYAEGRGHEFDYRIPNAWQYRDYVIRALNRDVPFDQFVTEHIAGDLLESPRRHPELGFNESIIATGFWYLGDWVHSPVDTRADEADRFDNSLDVYGKAFLGLTVACARCHDHKFDAISQEDYYALAGFLESSTYRQVRFETIDHNREVASQIDQLNRAVTGEVSQFVSSNARDVRAKLTRILAASIDLFGSRRTSAASDNADHLSEQLGIPASMLDAWVAELEHASAAPQHPLHALASEQVESSSILRHSNRQPHGLPSLLGDSHKVVVDYGAEEAAWLTDGPAYGAGPVEAGTILPVSEPGRKLFEVARYARAELRPNLADLAVADRTEQPEGRLGKWAGRDGKVLRTPTFRLDGGKLYYLIRGATRVQAVVNSHRMLAGPLHGETLKQIEHDDRLRWVEHDLTRYQGNGVHVEFGPLDSHPLEVAMVVQGDKTPQPPESLAGVQSRLVSENIAIQETARRIDEAFVCLQTGEPNHRSNLDGVTEWLLNHPELWSQGPGELRAIAERYHESHEEILRSLRPQSALAPAAWDGTSEDARFLVRGSTAAPRNLVPRRMLTAIAGAEQPPITEGSGRLKLAALTLAPDNPFPARVAVNRIWYHLMGRGIVPTVDNFGVLGERPTHPLLLDHLASRFVESRWSTKQLIRAIVLSRTYQMDSRRRPDAEVVDPTNSLYHRRPTKRLTAEAIRDAMLTASGRLDPKQFGPSVPIYLTDFMQGRGRPSTSGPLDGQGRRSIYQGIRRNFPSPMMAAFDAPAPSGTVGRRNVSNVPAQALILLNDPFVHDQAKAFARRVLTGSQESDARIEQAYLCTLGREPTAEEVERCRNFVQQQRGAWRRHDDEAPSDLMAWVDLCHTMFNTKEFLFLR